MVLSFRPCPGLFRWALAKTDVDRLDGFAPVPPVATATCKLLTDLGSRKSKHAHQQVNRARNPGLDAQMLFEPS